MLIQDCSFSSFLRLEESCKKASNAGMVYSTSDSIYCKTHSAPRKIKHYRSAGERYVWFSAVESAFWSMRGLLRKNLNRLFVLFPFSVKPPTRWVISVFRNKELIFFMIESAAQPLYMTHKALLLPGPSKRDERVPTHFKLCVLWLLLFQGQFAHISETVYFERRLSQHVVAFIRQQTTEDGLHDIFNRH